jgi:hypothetical protein
MARIAKFTPASRTTAHDLYITRPVPNTTPKTDWAHFDPPKREDEDALREAFGIPRDY